MGSDIQGTASLSLAAAIREVRQFRGEMQGLTNDVRRYNAVIKDSQKGIQGHLQAGGRALAKSGSPVGTWSGRLLGGAAMEGGFGRVAVGLAVITTAWKAYEAVVEANIDRTQKFLDAQKRLRDIAEGVDKALKQQGQNAEGQAAAQRRLAAAGGEQAKSDADLVAGMGVATRGEAEQGVADIFDRMGPGARASKAVDVAARAARAGVPFSEAAKQAGDFGTALDDSSQADLLAGMIVQKLTGAIGNPEDVLKDRIKRTAQDPFLKAAEGAAGVRAGVPGVERGRDLSAGAREDLAAAKDPASAAAVKDFREQTQKQDALKALAEAEGAFVSFIRTVTSAAGSANTQLMRMQKAEAAAQGLPPVGGNGAMDAIEWLGRAAVRTNRQGQPAQGGQ